MLSVPIIIIIAKQNKSREIALRPSATFFTLKWNGPRRHKLDTIPGKHAKLPLDLLLALTLSPVLMTSYDVIGRTVPIYLCNVERQPT